MMFSESIWKPADPNEPEDEKCPHTSWGHHNICINLPGNELVTPLVCGHYVVTWITLIWCWSTLRAEQQLPGPACVRGMTGDMLCVCPSCSSLLSLSTASADAGVFLVLMCLYSYLPFFFINLPGNESDSEESGLWRNVTWRVNQKFVWISLRADVFLILRAEQQLNGDVLWVCAHPQPQHTLIH